MPEYFRSTFTYEGKRYQIYGHSQREADQKAALKLADLRAGTVVASTKTVDAWWPEYIRTYHARASKSTVELYNGIYRKAIAPEIGPRPLKSVRSADLQRILNNLSNRSESYAKKAKMLLVGLFSTAAENDLIPKSPAGALKMPATAEPRERRSLTPAERVAFLAASEELGERGLFFRIIYFCGLRPSEVCRLRFEDVRAGVLHVRGTKTKAATRDVPVPAAFVFPEGSGQVFTTARSGSTPTKKALRYWWRQLSAKMAELSEEPVAEDLTPYCLRHDYCTRLQEAGVPIDVARRLMGHSSVEVTSRIYTHASNVTLEAARKLIDAN